MRLISCHLHHCKQYCSETGQGEAPGRATLVAISGQGVEMLNLKGVWQWIVVTRSHLLLAGFLPCHLDVRLQFQCFSILA